MKLSEQDKAQIIEEFEFDTDYERTVMKIYNPAFKMRHLKKLLKKVEEGRPLNKREEMIVKPIDYPVYDMDGSYYHPELDWD